MAQPTNLYLLDADAEPLYGAPNLTGTPERNLLMALLERAILDSVGNDQKQMEDAEDWLYNHEDDQYERHRVFSFSWVCEQLELDPKHISDTVAAMPKRGNRKVAPWYFMKSEKAKKRA